MTRWIYLTLISQSISNNDVSVKVWLGGIIKYSQLRYEYILYEWQHGSSHVSSTFHSGDDLKTKDLLLVIQLLWYWTDIWQPVTREGDRYDDCHIEFPESDKMLCWIFSPSYTDKAHLLIRVGHGMLLIAQLILNVSLTMSTWTWVKWIDIAR